MVAAAVVAIFIFGTAADVHSHVAAPSHHAAVRTTSHCSFCAAGGAQLLLPSRCLTPLPTLIAELLHHAPSAVVADTTRSASTSRAPPHR